jgi:hypothetical protein
MASITWESPLELLRREPYFSLQLNLGAVAALLAASTSDFLGLFEVAYQSVIITVMVMLLRMATEGG